MNAIETHGLTRQYGKAFAVKDLNLKVRPGTVYGFLGPNGAGKSTTIKMLMGFARPTSGTASIMGLDVKTKYLEIRKMTGYLPEQPAFYEDMTARDNLEYFGDLTGLKNLDKRMDEVFSQVGLEGRYHDKVKTYSHGMRQRLGIAIALLGDPKLLIMDEPTTGLDPQGSHDIRELIKKFKKDNITIFLSSHQLHEVQDICDTVGIIKDGGLIAEGSIDDFLRGIEGNKPIMEFTVSSFEDAQVRLIESIKGVKGVTAGNGTLKVTVDDHSVTEDVTVALVNAGVRIRGVREVMPTLEDAFLRAIRESQGEGQA
jgi:ABC-2 type transport system ATP-binding protein